MRRKIPLVENEIYHIVIRGVEGINIFRDVFDYKRFMTGLYEFNSDKPVSIWANTRVQRIVQGRSLHNSLVDILTFCLMPNHVHLLLRQKREKGITDFMKKLGTGYAVYFNIKYKRSGYVFQGRFRSIHIKNDNQLKTVFVYIHTNPAILVDKNWKDGVIKNANKIIKFIEHYKWCGYLYYLGKEKKSSHILTDNFMTQIMSSSEWQVLVNDWIKYKSGVKDLDSVILE